MKSEQEMLELMTQYFAQHARRLAAIALAAAVLDSPVAEMITKEAEDFLKFYEAWLSASDSPKNQAPELPKPSDPNAN